VLKDYLMDLQRELDEGTGEDADEESLSDGNGIRSASKSEIDSRIKKLHSQMGN